MLCKTARAKKDSEEKKNSYERMNERQHRGVVLERAIRKQKWAKGLNETLCDSSVETLAALQK